MVGKDAKSEVIGYDNLESEVKIIKYRRLKQKNKELFQLVFDKTPFYAESGGQVGDTGYIESAYEKIYIIDTKKENELIVHFADSLPENLNATFNAVVDKSKRQLSMDNHSATHLLHAALRQVLGKHVEQKGSLVHVDLVGESFALGHALELIGSARPSTPPFSRRKEIVEISSPGFDRVFKVRSLGYAAMALPYGAVIKPRGMCLALLSSVHFERIKTPGIAHVAYFLGAKGEALVVDPRRDVDEYLKIARKNKLTIKFILETHRQEDFVIGSNELTRLTGAKVVTLGHELFGHSDIRLKDGEALTFAGLRVVALHTPGHTPESTSYAVSILRSFLRLCQQIQPHLLRLKKFLQQQEFLLALR